MSANSSSGLSSHESVSAETMRAHEAEWRLERHAQRTAKLILDALAEQRALPARLLTADEVADYLAIDVGFVYENSDRLGAIRLGDGPRARLRFRLERVDEWLASCPGGRESGGSRSGAVERKSRRRGSMRSGSGVPLLPVCDRETGS